MARDSALSDTRNAAVSPRELDRWVGELRSIVVGGHVQILAAVGEFLIERVFEGNVAEARSRQAGKRATLEQLAARAEEFGMKPSAVARAIPIALQVRSLGKTIAYQLGVRHHRELLPVKDAAEKKQLAEEAVESRWTADELRKHVRNVQEPHAGGVDKQPAVRLLVRRASAILEAPRPGEVSAGVDEIGLPEARRLLARVNAMQAQLERLEKSLTRLALGKKER